MIMPVFKEYSESYNKDGYYVHAPIDGLSHPLPLQTPDITARIYHELGYSPNDHVPNELTWKLYDVGLHWTENTGADHLSQDELKSAIVGESGPDFTSEQAETILSIVESYSGKYESELEALVDELDTEGGSQQRSPNDEAEEDSSIIRVEELMSELEDGSGISNFQETVDRPLSDDEIQLVEEVATPDKIDTIDGVTFGVSDISTKGEYFERLAQCQNVVTSLDEFSAAGPLELWRVVPIPPSVGYSYETDIETLDNDLYEDLQHLVVSDHRWNDEIDEDLKITVSKAGVSVRFLIHDEHISEFAVITPDQEIGPLEREATEQAATEDLSADQLMHHGLGTVIEGASIVEDLLGDISSYRLCPVGPFYSA